MPERRAEDLGIEVALRRALDDGPGVPVALNAIEIFHPNRCMFASMPICRLACSFEQLYLAYGEIIEGFSLTEKRRMVHDTAAALYGISQS